MIPRPILIYGNPLLESANEPVSEFGPALKELADELFETGWRAPGLGVAAPQIGVNQRLAVIDVSVGKDPASRLVLANPEIIHQEGEVSLDEGCLSFPGLFTKINRPKRVVVRAQDGEGTWRETEADDLLAQALCHEIDHLDGVLLVHRLRGLKRRLFIRRIRKMRQSGAWE